MATEKRVQKEATLEISSERKGAALNVKQLSAHILSMKAAPQTGQHLVADGSGSWRDIVHGLVLADEFDEIAGVQRAGRQRRNVEDDAVHRHTAGERQPHALEEARPGQLRPGAQPSA